MTDNKELTVVQVLRKEKALDVIAYMREGMSQKDALEKASIEKRTFNNILADYPEIMEAIAAYHRTRVLNIAERIIDDQEKNAEALSAFSETLRLRLKADVLAQGAVKPLIAIDKHLQNALKILNPIVKEVPREPVPDDADKARANLILSQMNGAQLRHVEVKVETYRMEIGGQKSDPSDVVIDGEATEVDASQGQE